jgi:predicted RNA binding protein YcfA (HicA-like mRNA interferase family)
MPSATARDFQRAARQLGFIFNRTTGSHERWIHTDGRAVTIPIHGGKEIGPPLFFKILRQLGVSAEEFARLK